MTQQELDRLRRDVHYAALPGKINTAVLIAVVCFLAGTFGFFSLLWLYGFLVRLFFGGFE